MTMLDRLDDFEREYAEVERSIADPEVIAGAAAETSATGKFDNWKKWPRLLAVARNNLFVIDGDLISRHTPRMLEGARIMCEQIDAARARRPGAR